jgi:hypothetical protein
MTQNRKDNAGFGKKEEQVGKPKGVNYTMQCPDCDAENSLRRYGDDKTQPVLNKIAGLDGDEALFYKCVACHGEFFDDEIVLHPYKTGVFTNEKGEQKYVPYTKNVMLRRERKKALSYRDRKLLRRLKK